MACVAATSGLKSPLHSIGICSLFSPKLHCSLEVVEEVTVELRVELGDSRKQYGRFIVHSSGVVYPNKGEKLSHRGGVGGGGSDGGGDCGGGGGGGEMHLFMSTLSWRSTSLLSLGQPSLPTDACRLDDQ